MADQLAVSFHPDRMRVVFVRRIGHKFEALASVQQVSTLRVVPVTCDLKHEITALLRRIQRVHQREAITRKTSLGDRKQGEWT